MGFKKHSRGKRERLAGQLERALAGQPLLVSRAKGGIVIHKVPNAVVESIWGEPMRETGPDGEVKPLELSLAVKAMVMSLKQLKGQKITLNDEEMALLVAQTLRGSHNGVLEFEETPYKWLLELVKQEGPKLLSPNTTMVVAALEARAPDAAPTS